MVVSAWVAFAIGRSPSLGQTGGSITAAGQIVRTSQVKRLARVPPFLLARFGQCAQVDHPGMGLALGAINVAFLVAVFISTCRKGWQDAEPEASGRYAADRGWAGVLAISAVCAGLVITHWLATAGEIARPLQPGNAAMLADAMMPEAFSTEEAGGHHDSNGFSDRHCTGSCTISL
jgi:hypothetical protein